MCSLLKVHLQLRGLTVFLDIEKLRAGKFDDNLLNSVRNARHFILVLTPNALERCVGDNDRKDWVHRVKTILLTYLLPSLLSLSVIAVTSCNLRRLVIEICGLRPF